MNKFFTPALLTLLCVFSLATFAQKGSKQFTGAQATTFYKGA